MKWHLEQTCDGIIDSFQKSGKNYGDVIVELLQLDMVGK